MTEDSQLHFNFPVSKRGPNLHFLRGVFFVYSGRPFGRGPRSPLFPLFPDAVEVLLPLALGRWAAPSRGLF